MSGIRRLLSVMLAMTMAVSVIPAVVYAENYGWVKKGGKWYYYDEDGKKVKYATEYDGTTDSYYVLNGKGQRVTTKGWYKTSYIITNYGDKVKCVNWFYIKKGGKVTTGWKKIKGKYYYFFRSGYMAMAEAVKVDSKYYLVDENGVRVTKKGWHTVKNTYVSGYDGDKTTSKNTYYVNSKGNVVRGKKTIKGKNYFFNDEGIMYKSTFHMLDNGDIIVFGKDGAQITKKGLVEIKSTRSSEYDYYVRKVTDKDIYYIKKDGTAAKGWKKVGDKWYYFDPTWAHARRSTTMKSDDKTKTYIFNKDGVCINY